MKFSNGIAFGTRKIWLTLGSYLEYDADHCAIGHAHLGEGMRSTTCPGYYYYYYYY